MILSFYKPILLLSFSFLSCLMFSSCDNHSHPPSTLFTGDFRVYAGISEFYDCQSGKKYYLGDKGIKIDLEKKFKALQLAEKDDAYLEVEGYLMRESAKNTLIPSTIFVATKFISFDANRGCSVEARQGY